MQTELEYRRKNNQGIEFTSPLALDKELRKIGYRLDRKMDCRSTARWMTGDRAGESYPACSTGIKEVDTGLSAFNVDARRDANFDKLQELRITGAWVAMHNGYILEI